MSIGTFPVWKGQTSFSGPASAIEFCTMLAIFQPHLYNMR